MSGDRMLPVGTNYCRCPACGHYFGGERAFNAHRIGKMVDRRCEPPSGMRDKGLAQDARGYWRRAYHGAA